MHTTRSTRSSVLGKRPHQPTVESDTSSVSQCGQALPTPEPTPNPKRVRISVAQADGDSNKENIPPFKGEVLNSPSTRSMRALRRTHTEIITASRPRNSPRRHASSDLLSTPTTPVTTLSHLSLVTPPPSPPSALIPLHVRVRALLRLTCSSVVDIAGRHDEREVIRKFIADFFPSDRATSNEHSALYISGSPGTGKTALVNAVLHTLQADLEAHHATVLSVNCMALNGVDGVWERLAEDLSADVKHPKKDRKSRKLKETPNQVVKRLLTERKSKCIVVLDELDHIASSSQSLISLFTLAQTLSSQLRLIGIANTHTLTSSSSTTLAFQSLTGVATVHFAPYTPQQLLEIVKFRLSPLFVGDDTDSAERATKFLPIPTLTLLTKKIAAQTGDVRAVFEVLRGAIDLAVNSTTSPDPLNVPVPTVTPSDVLAALKAYAPAGSQARCSPSASLPTPGPSPAAARRPSDSEVVTKVRELGLHARLVLLAMLLGRKRLDVGLTFSGSLSSSPGSRSPIKRTASSPNTLLASNKAAGMDISQLHGYYSAILTRDEHSVFSPVSRSEFGDLMGILETVGIVVLSSGYGSVPGTPSKSGRRGFGRTTSFSMGVGKGGGQDVRFVEGIRLDEVSRGLGIHGADSKIGDVVDVREEEVHAIWERERVRIARETKVSAKSADSGVFGHAMED